MYDTDDPLDESKDLGQHNQDWEEAGNGDRVDSAVGTIAQAGAVGAALTAGMLLGPRLMLEWQRRQRVQELVCAPVTCPDCACHGGVCCALGLCGTECTSGGRAGSS